MNVDTSEFLEPPHAHDPDDVSQFVQVPTEIVTGATREFHHALDILKQSTSVAYASLCRLKKLEQEKFSRLVPLKSQGDDATKNHVKDVHCESKRCWSNALS